MAWPTASPTPTSRPSSPYALACGGTKLVASGPAISSEVVWNEGPNSATGGGLSAHFPVPDYQQQLKFPTPPAGANAGRGLPDVAGDADPNTGYQVRVDGQNLVIGGTSAVAPLWAGLLALLNQKLPKPVGFLNPLLYGSLAGQGATRDITSGNNGAFAAGPGWDACTGWGSPVGSKLLAAAAAGRGGSTSVTWFSASRPGFDAPTYYRGCQPKGLPEWADANFDITPHSPPP